MFDGFHTCPKAPKAGMLMRTGGSCCCGMRMSSSACCCCCCGRAPFPSTPGCSLLTSLSPSPKVHGPPVGHTRVGQYRAASRAFQTVNIDLPGSLAVIQTVKRSRISACSQAGEIRGQDSAGRAMPPGQAKTFAGSYPGYMLWTPYKLYVWCYTIIC